MAPPSAPDRDPGKATGLQVGSWTNLALGIGIAAMAIAAEEGGAVFWTTLLGGALIAALGGAAAWAGLRGRFGAARGPSILSLALGAGIAVAPFVLGGPWPFAWTSAVLGGLVVLVAAYDLWAAVGAGAEPPGRAA